ncbi:excinuclease ABC subunit C, partial [Klebsiella pneumoniae]|nr:excinuclease ABC subunit C [Klebsiella pneumoniae]
DLPDAPTRIEVYDNSHIQGANAIGAFIVAGPEGFDKRSYRTFNIKDTELQAGDDYAMMREVLRRRFARLVKEDPERTSGAWPDLVVIDGGTGQLAAAQATLAELDLADLPLMAVAKGPERNAGQERFFLPEREPLALEPRD